MLEALSEHKEAVIWLASASVVMFVGSLLLVPVLVVRMAADYFHPHREPAHRLAVKHPVARAVGLVLKNLAGLVLVLAGIAMLFLPGQGLLTIVFGIAMLDFPGKRRLELRLIRLPGLLRGINALRARYGRPPLDLPAA